MAEAGDGSGHTPLTPEWTPAPRASHYPWQGDRPAPSAPSFVSGPFISLLFPFPFSPPLSSPTL